VVLDDAMMLNIAVDESPYPQPTPQEKKRLKEIAFEEQKKMYDLVRNKDLDKALDDVKTEINTKIEGVKTEINKNTDTKIEGVKTEIIVVQVVSTFVSTLFMFYLKKDENDIKR